ncbi:hypothetical protein [Gorillibacterium sp. sgz5001074]|uniref:hypothetical protein n=1 Tax=Gorillibacterium sp. sgz5001074 TaxID=3446695 RepID=UPI003F66F792
MKALYDELTAKDDSFLIDFRIKLEWNHNKFVNLLKLLNDYCISTSENKILDRKFAAGIYYISIFIPDWSSHENFRSINKMKREYYIEAYELLHYLTSWYFSGNFPFIGEPTMLNQIKELDKYM